MNSEMDGCMLGLYEKAIPDSFSIEEKLGIASRNGFDFLEISIDETDDKLSRLNLSKGEQRELSSAVYRSGIPITTMCLSGHRKYSIGNADGAKRARGMEIMTHAIEFAANMGIRIIQLAGYDTYYEPSTDMTRTFFLENLEVCTELAARKGIVLAFETMETDFMNTVGKAMEYVRTIDSPYLQIYPDIGNLTNASCTYGTTVNDDLEKGRGHLVAMHLKETVPGKFREIRYGTGHVDFTGSISYAKKLGVRIFLAEFWAAGRPDWMDQIGFAHDFLREKL